jgi:hypothetical protein
MYSTSAFFAQHRCCNATSSAILDAIAILHCINYCEAIFFAQSFCPNAFFWGVQLSRSFPRSASSLLQHLYIDGLNRTTLLSCYLAPHVQFQYSRFFSGEIRPLCSSQKPNSSYLTYHAHYSTHVWCTDNTCITAELRMYTSTTTPLIPDGMVAFAVCTAQHSPSTNTQITTPNPLLLDVLTFIILPGDPNSSTYNVFATSSQISV